MSRFALKRRAMVNPFAATSMNEVHRRFESRGVTITDGEVTQLLFVARYVALTLGRLHGERTVAATYVRDTIDYLNFFEKPITFDTVLEELRADAARLTLQQGAV
jgi:hypothetical protein